MMNYLIAAIVGYLIGSVNPAYIFGKMKGFDIRERGSGNAGASNAKVTLGWKYFFIVAIYDITKAMISVAIIRYIYPDNQVIEILCGCAAVFGHCFPFYLNFKGGKGFACYIGLSLMIDFRVFACIIVAAIILALLTNYIVTATAILTFALPIVSFILGLDPMISICLSITSLMMVYQHRSNIRKFFRKEEIGINGKPVGIRMNKDL